MSSNYPLDKYIDIEKTLGFNESKYQKTKTKVKKIVSDFYKEPIEQLSTVYRNTTRTNVAPEQAQTTNLESQLNGVIESNKETKDIQSESDQQIPASLNRSRRRRRFNVNS
ncbi:MAG: hypothetical protein Ta2E_11190 [Mycoplasmoidaceae bacterium]|nr:MAG: hypothetical protein Ta2E_11190 [Mycoplasmoidaceae bacterium]